MPAAVHQRFAAHAGAAAPDEQQADALRSVELVGAGAQQVDVHGVHVDPFPPVRLGGVGVEQDPALAAQGADAGDGVQDAGLVVGVHDRDEQGALGDRPGEAVEVEAPVAVDPQAGDVEALPL